MIIKNITNIIKKILENHRKKNILYLRAIIHFVRYCFIKSYRKNRCVIDPPQEFFYKYGKMGNYFSILLFFFQKYLKKKKILISINNDCNSSMGHIYGEIGQIHRMQKSEEIYSDKVVWFATSRKEILGETKEIFENRNFKILIGGVKRIFLILVAIKYPSISIDGSISHTNYFLGKNHSDRVVFHDMPKKYAKLICNTEDFYPNKDKVNNYDDEKKKLFQNLKIKKKYIVIQIKTFLSNGTLEPLNPNIFLKTIEYFQNKDFQIVFAGREEFPEVFLNNSIINYARSKYASALNDFLLIAHSSLVLSSGSGFCFLPESLDKPLLVINAHHICQYFGRRTIYLPTLLSRKSEKFNARIQHEYLCTYGKRNGYFTFDDIYIHHIPTSDEIFMAAKELEEYVNNKVPKYTSLQKKIRDNDGCPLLSVGLSNISNYFLTKHENFFH